MPGTAAAESGFDEIPPGDRGGAGAGGRSVGLTPQQFRVSYSRIEEPPKTTNQIGDLVFRLNARPSGPALNGVFENRELPFSGVTTR